MLQDPSWSYSSSVCAYSDGEKKQFIVNILFAEMFWKILIGNHCLKTSKSRRQFKHSISGWLCLLIFKVLLSLIFLYLIFDVFELKFLS